MSKKNILTVQLCYVKLNAVETDVNKWNIVSLRDADKAEVKAFLDRIRGLKHEMDSISTLQLAKLTRKEVSSLDKRVKEVINDWKELRGLISFCTDAVGNDYYKILRMKPTTDFEEVKKAYKKRAQEVHPDHKGGSEEEFMKVKEAYEKLKKELNN